MPRRSPTPPAPDVGVRIKQRRNALKLSREQLAARIYIGTGATTTTNTVGRWEKTGRLTVGELRVVAEILEIDVVDLLNGASSGPADPDDDLAAELVARDAELGSKRQRTPKRRQP